MKKTGSGKAVLRPSSKKTALTSIAATQAAAETLLQKILERARRHPALVRLGRTRAPWSVGVAVLNGPAMTRLNGSYRERSYATDVLSFPAPEPFRAAGLLGELVLCFPVLKAQAREQGHASETELQILLIHGLLHLLGLDHEKSEREARLMSGWEAKLLARRKPGLIERND